MKKHKKVDAVRAARKTPRSVRIAIFAALALAGAGVVTAIARHESAATPDSVARASKQVIAPLAVTNAPGVSMRNLPLDVRTLQQRPLTQDEAQKMAETLKQMANQSTDGLVSVRHMDGSVSIDLQDRFQNVMLARKNADGTVEQACVDNPRAGAAFLGIDPQLVGDNTSPNPAPPRKAPAPIQ